jgi:hypothetical protein
MVTQTIQHVDNSAKYYAYVGLWDYANLIVVIIFIRRRELYMHRCPNIYVT